MSRVGAAAVAFAVGALFTCFELRFSKYPHTGSLIVWKRPFWIYCGLYGLVAVGGFLLSGLLIAKGVLKLGGLSLESPYGLAAVLGLSSKAIMQLSIFNVTAGSASFPIGFQTIVQVFEPYLLHAISLKEFNAVRMFVMPYALKYPDLNTVKTMIKNNIPDSISHRDRVAFEGDIDKDRQVHEAMERFLRFLGEETFLRVFSN